MTATAMIGRHLAAVVLSVTTSLAVTTCDIQANSAILQNESGEEGLSWQLMSAPRRVNVERPFIESVAFPGTRARGLRRAQLGLADRRRGRHRAGRTRP